MTLLMLCLVVSLNQGGNVFGYRNYIMNSMPWTDLNKIIDASFRKRIILMPLKEVNKAMLLEAT